MHPQPGFLGYFGGIIAVSEPGGEVFQQRSRLFLKQLEQEFRISL